MSDSLTDALLNIPGLSDEESLDNETSAFHSEALDNETGASHSEALDDETGTPPSEPPAKKKRRPRLPIKPALRSSRGRDLKLTQRYTNEGLKNDNRFWTIKERRQLLEALKEHGSSDMEKLAQAVPTRSAAAVSHFLSERRRRKDRIVLERAAGRRAAQAVRILRRALDVKRRRFDRSQALVEVLASCQQQQPAPDPTVPDSVELPQFADIYQMLRELMENKVPAVLGPCETFVVRRLIGTLVTAMNSLDLTEEREVLKRQLDWAAAQPMTGPANDATTPSTFEPDSWHSINFPSMKVRNENMRASWNPLRLPPEVIQKQWPVLDKLLQANVFSSDRTQPQVESQLPGDAKSGKRGGHRRRPQSLETFNAWKH
uniref:Myb-like domain-containing protein n=1 Tax=Amblyomma maculatum TaxID=34609 RepID=G3MLB7_AMBMU